MKIGHLFVALILLCPANGFCGSKADLVVVDKSEAKLYLIAGNKILHSFPVVFGANPKGHKVREGDERTPEGNYILDYKNGNSSFYKSIHISYPNKRDKARAAALGVPPGGDIMIHGQRNDLAWLAPITERFNWTDGCIAVRNQEMDIIWSAVEVGTPIIINP
jgi:murein L,D-transpeptidase YafK